MISIKKKSELTGAEKYGQCASCSKGSSETELYRISFTYDGSTKTHSIDLCPECMKELETTMKRALDGKNFNPGDRVYHKNLKLYGTFVGYAWESDDECDVDFEMEDGEIEQRHVSVSWLKKA